MKQTSEYKMTPFDVSVQSPSLQMLKGMIPFLPKEKRRFLGILIKFTELQNTIRLFQRNDNSITSVQKDFSFMELIHIIMDYSDPDQKQQMESILQMMQTMEMFDAFQGKTSEDYTSMLSPEQFEKFKEFESDFM